ncbi:MAG: TolC family protein [Myxococcaceae bacterium]|nr:TolC family protein [Myxococcaceae bacterium]
MIAALVALALAAPITLDEVKAASRQNLEALRAEIEVRRQTLGVDVAKSAIYPQLSVTAQGQGFYAGAQRVLQNAPVFDATGNITGFQQRIGDIPISTSRANFNLGITVSQLIYDGGRWWNQIAQAGHQETAAEGQLAEQRLVSEQEAVNRFFTLLQAQLSLSVLENAVKRSQDQVARAESLYQAGRAGKFDALNAQVNLGNDRISSLRQVQTVVASQVELLKWLGQSTRDVEAVDPGGIAQDEPQAPAPAYDTALAVAKKHRPLLQALDAQVAVQQSAVDLGWAPFLPSVSLQGGYQRQAPTVDPFFTDPSRNNVLWGGLNLSWNVFNGFGNQAQLNQARESLSQATLQRERAEVDLGGDLRRVIRALETQLQVAAVAADNLRLSQAGLTLAEERFNAGAGSTIEVRDAQVKLITAQLSSLQARVDVEIARAALKRVVGADVEGDK